MSYKENLSYKLQNYNGPRLVGLQYEAIIENLNEIKNIASSENIDKNRISLLLDNNRDIFSNLMVGLKENNEFNNKTKSLYLYFIKETEEALINKDMSKIEKIISLLESTKNAWEKIAENIEKDMDISKNKHNIGATYSKNDVNIFESGKNWKV